MLVAGDGLGRYPIEVEAAAYFCITEAITNAVKHAEAERIDVRLAEETDGLSFVVQDNGVGFDASVVSEGSGVVGMRDRGWKQLGDRWRCSRHLVRELRSRGSSPGRPRSESQLPRSRFSRTSGVRSDLPMKPIAPAASARGSYSSAS